MKRFGIPASLLCVPLSIAIWSLCAKPSTGDSDSFHAPVRVEGSAPHLIGGSITASPIRACEVDGWCCESTTTAGIERLCDADLLLLEIDRALVSVDESQRERAYTQLLPVLMAIDPPAVAGLVEESSDRVREELLHHAARAWTATDPDGAVEWAAALKDDNERRTVVSNIASQLAQTDPARAIEVSDLFDIGRDNGAVEHLAQVWATTDLHEALDWIQEQPAGPARDQLLARVLAVQAETEPESAAAAALSQIAAGTTQQNAVGSVLRRWVMQDADAASEWAENLPNATLREYARRELSAAHVRATSSL